MVADFYWMGHLYWLKIIILIFIKIIYIDWNQSPQNKFKTLSDQYLLQNQPEVSPGFLVYTSWCFCAILLNPRLAPLVRISIIACKALVIYRNASQIMALIPFTNLMIHMTEGVKGCPLYEYHWSPQDLFPNICPIVGDENQLKRRNLWKAKNISTSNWESGIIRWMQLAGSHVYAENIIIPVIRNICCAWQTQWNSWIHRKEHAENGFNMILFFHSIPIDWGCPAKNNEKMSQQ